MSSGRRTAPGPSIARAERAMIDPRLCATTRTGRPCRRQASSISAELRPEHTSSDGRHGSYGVPRQEPRHGPGDR